LPENVASKVDFVRGVNGNERTVKVNGFGKFRLRQYAEQHNSPSGCSRTPCIMSVEVIGAY
jgi:hypothetical protein